MRKNKIQAFIFVPLNCKGTVYLLSDMSNSLFMSHVDIPVMLFACNLVSVTECEIAEVQVRSVTNIVAVAASIVNAICTLGFSLWKTFQIRQIKFDVDPSVILKHSCTFIMINLCCFPFISPTPSIICVVRHATYFNILPTVVFLLVISCFMFHLRYYKSFPKYAATGFIFINFVLCFLILVFGALFL